MKGVHPIHLMRITRVYTRKGDKGMTQLVGNQEVSKSCQRVEAYGCVDELNSSLGLARALLGERKDQLSDEDVASVLTDLDYLQNHLFIMGGDLATQIDDRWAGMPLITIELVREIESRIDRYNSDLPPLAEFILPTGTTSVAAIHLARTICRRAEREAIRLQKEEDIGEAVIPFLNRLSDFLFVLARWISKRSGSIETTWRR